MLRTSLPAHKLAHTLLAQGGFDRNRREIAEISGVHPDTVTNKFNEYSNTRIFLKDPRRLGPGLGFAIGVSLGREILRVGLVGADGVLRHEIAYPPEPGLTTLSPANLMQRIRTAVAEVLSIALADPEMHLSNNGHVRILGIGVAWPTPVDRRGRPGGHTLKSSAWRTDESIDRLPIPLPNRVRDALPGFELLDSYALNDVNAHALSVAFDMSLARANDENDDQWRVVLVVHLGGGVGAGTIQIASHKRDRLAFVDSTLVTGTRGFAGEIGHLPVDLSLIKILNKSLPGSLVRLSELAMCSCDELGHLESYAGATAVARRLHESGFGDAGAFTGVIDAATADGASNVQVRALDDVGRLMGAALASPILMLDPYCVVLTGALATEHVITGIRKESARWSHAGSHRLIVDRLPHDEPAANFAGVRGAALAVVRNSVHRRFEDIFRAGGNIPWARDIDDQFVKHLAEIGVHARLESGASGIASAH